MTMELQDLFIYLMSAAIGVIGWFARVLWEAVSSLKDDMAKLKENLPLYYVRKDDFKEFRHNVMDSLHRIELLLSGKADK
jgi:hypothetical protein